MIYLASIAAWIAISLLGRGLLALAGMSQFSLFGGCFVLGYSTLGLALLASLRFLGGGESTAILLAAVGAIASLLACLRHFKDGWRNFLGRACFGAASPSLYAIVLPWIACVCLVYWPIGEYAGAPTLNLPDIFDLPKHLFAERALFEATGWPVSNPFFYGEPFAYNFLFYCPPAAIAKLFGNPLAVFQTFPVFAVAVAAALPLTVLDIVCLACGSSVARIGAALLSTWTGGFTPIFVHTVPAIGFALHAEGIVRDQLWVDETFLSAIYVPQHIFAVLCALMSMGAIATVRDLRTDWARILISATTTSAGALSSLILLPHLIVSYALGIGVLLILAGQERKSDLFGTQLLAWAALCSVPAIVVLPFALEAMAWSSGVGPLLAAPAHLTQWPYLVGCFGLTIPLACVGAATLGTNLRRLRIGSALHQLANSIILSLVGATAYLFLGYPDAGLKSGLWLRIVLVVAASVGLQSLFDKIPLPHRRLAKYGLVAIFLAIAAINTPAIAFYVRSAWQPLDASVSLLISFVRALPSQARFVLLPPEQQLAAMLGQNVDFDFFPLRADAYLPPASRARAREFWDGLAKQSPDAWRELERRYDYAIVIAPSPAAARFSDDRGALARYGPYSIYRLAGK